MKESYQPSMVYYKGIRFEKESNRILGVTLFCAEAHELINICKLAIDNNITADQLKNQIYTHPTMAEALNDLFA